MHALRSLGLLAALLVPLAPSVARAQVQVVEESQAQEQIVERGEIPGRGAQLGGYLVFPVFATPMVRDDGTELPILVPGVGLGIRGGWESPDGIAIELFLELVGNGVENPGDLSVLLFQLGFGANGRYFFFNPSAFVPFLQVQVGLRFMGFDWPDGVESPDQSATVDFLGGLGAQIELSYFMGIEVGALVGAMMPGAFFRDAIFVIYPFAGLTFYTDAEND